MKTETVKQTGFAPVSCPARSAGIDKNQAGIEENFSGRIFGFASTKMTPETLWDWEDIAREHYLGF